MVLRAMHKAINQGVKEPAIRRLVWETRYLSNNEYIFLIYYIVGTLVVFERNPKDEQRIRTAVRTFRDLKGSCVDATVCLGTLLKARSIPFYIRRVKKNNPKHFDHVYIVIKNGPVLDANMTWETNGDPYSNFGRETKSLTFDDTLIL